MKSSFILVFELKIQNTDAFTRIPQIILLLTLMLCTIKVNNPWIRREISN